MSNFRNWYITNYTKINWFIIGFLIASALEQIVRGHYGSAAINLGIAYVNYLFGKNEV
jgi:hypothetical protein